MSQASLTHASAALLRDAVAAEGGELLTWRLRQVHGRRSFARVVVDARVGWADRDQDETYVVGHGDGRVWRFPLDPDLPALPAACDRSRVRDLLVELGLVGPGTRLHDVRITRRGYRPGQRAVLEARAGEAAVFLKVARPHRIGEVHRRHRLLHESGVPVAAPLHVTPEGLLVLESLPGRSLRSAVRSAGAAALRPERLLEVLDALPAGLLSLTQRPAWADHATHYADVLSAALPAEAARAGYLASVVQEGLAGLDEPVRPVHGDLYEAHVLVGSGRVTGLLDVDGAGPGRRSDDLACLLAHLEVLALVRPQDRTRVRGALETWGGALVSGSGVDPRAVRLRTVGVLLSLATEPYRRQQREWRAATSARLELADGWRAGSALQGGS